MAARQFAWYRDTSNLSGSIYANTWTWKTMTGDLPSGSTLTRVNLSYTVTDSSVDTLTKLSKPRAMIFDLSWYPFDQGAPNSLPSILNPFDRELLWYELVTGWQTYEVHSPTAGETVIYRTAFHRDLNIEAQRKIETGVPVPITLWSRITQADTSGGLPDVFIHADVSLSVGILLP